MRTIWIWRSRRALAVPIAAATLAALALGSIASMSANGAMSARANTLTPKALALHDAMRALWEAHGTWTERAIVDFAGGLPDVPVVVTRLLQNQTEIGNAIKPYYGTKAGNSLTVLLKAHINDAVAVLKAAKTGESSAIATAKAAFYANGNQVAAFLHAANPHHWSLAAMATMMRIHLNQVVGLATDQLEGHYEAAAGLYDAYIAHLMDMADMLSRGILEQFPAHFREQARCEGNLHPYTGRPPQGARPEVVRSRGGDCGPARSSPAGANRSAARQIALGAIWLPAVGQGRGACSQAQGPVQVRVRC